MVDFAASSGGVIFLFVLRVAQTYSNKRNLQRCSKVGIGVFASHGLQIDNEGTIAIEDNASIMSNVQFSCYKGGSIAIGENCFVGRNVVIVSETGNISIGRDCLIAEDVSIRASNHGTRLGTLIRLQPSSVKDIQIGSDVWIGKGVTVLAGSSIADGCVIGANSVVRGSTEPNGIYAGSPIRKIRLRSD